LGGGREIAYLVQKESAALGDFDEALLVALGSTSKMSF
jgi:hypothetical protein